MKFYGSMMLLRPFSVDTLFCYVYYFYHFFLDQQVPLSIVVNYQSHVGSVLTGVRIRISSRPNFLAFDISFFLNSASFLKKALLSQLARICFLFSKIHLEQYSSSDFSELFEFYGRDFLLVQKALLIEIEQKYQPLGINFAIYRFSTALINFSAADRQICWQRKLFQKIE